jgi:hypothetical protein
VGFFGNRGAAENLEGLPSYHAALLGDQDLAHISTIQAIMKDCMKVKHMLWVKLDIQFRLSII